MPNTDMKLLRPHLKPHAATSNCGGFSTSRRPKQVPVKSACVPFAWAGAIADFG